MNKPEVLSRLSVIELAVIDLVVIDLVVTEQVITEYMSGDVMDAAKWRHFCDGRVVNPMLQTRFSQPDAVSQMKSP
ncbi:MAG: hypothetical protein ACRDCX_12220 [Aeromonas sp.]